MSNSTVKGGMFAAKAAMYKGAKAKANKNGEMPVVLVVFAGSCPKKRVIDGSVFSNMNIELDTSYLFTYTPGDIDPDHGREYSFQAIAEIVSVMDTIKIVQELGDPELLED